MEEKKKTTRKTANTKGKRATTTKSANVKKNTTKKVNKVVVEEKLDVKKENKTLNKLKDFLNRPAPLIITLIVIIVFLLLFIYKNITSSTIYVGTVSNDDLQIGNVHIFVNNDMNYFYATTALYTGEDKQVYNYQIGYYVVDSSGNYIEFASRSEESDTAASLSTIVEELSAWNIGEANVSDYFFTTDVIKNISNLHFVIKASTEEDSTDADVYIDYEVELEKITKS